MEKASNNIEYLGSSLHLKVPDGVVALTLHYSAEYEDVLITLKRQLRGDGHEHFICEDGTVLPLDVPAVVDVVKQLEECHRSFYVSDQELHLATERAKTIYGNLRKKHEETHLKTIAKDAVRKRFRRVPLNVLNRAAETIRKRLKRWIEETQGR